MDKELGEEKNQQMENIIKEEDMEYTCLMCGEKIKKQILMKKIQCLKCGSKVFKKERKPGFIKKILAR